MCVVIAQANYKSKHLKMRRLLWPSNVLNWNQSMQATEQLVQKQFTKAKYGHWKCEGGKTPREVICAPAIYKSKHLRNWWKYSDLCRLEPTASENYMCANVLRGCLKIPHLLYHAKANFTTVKKLKLTNFCLARFTCKSGYWNLSALWHRLLLTAFPGKSFF